MLIRNNVKFDQYTVWFKFHLKLRGWTGGGGGYGDKVGGIGDGGGGIGGGGGGIGVEGAGVEGAGSLEKLGREIDFLNRKFRENGSFRPISYIKVHQGKHAYFVDYFVTQPT